MMHNKRLIYLLLMVVLMICIFSQSVLGVEKKMDNILNYDVADGNYNLTQEFLFRLEEPRLEINNKDKFSFQSPAFDCFKDLLNEYTFNSHLEARLFQLERTRLGANFEQELYQLVENNMYASYKCGMFLLKPTYLYGNSPAPKTALNVFELGLQIEAITENLKYRKIGLLVMAAVANQKYGSVQKAKRFKSEVENILASQPFYNGGFPALVEQDRQIYNSISFAAKQNKKLTNDK